MAKGDTKTNQYLDIAANGTRADLPTDTCCETRSQTLIREVAERIMDVEDEVEEIKNNPDVVDIVPTYADLQNYDTSGLTDKDIIRVLQDETHDGDSTYYRYNAQSSTWTYVGESKQYEDFVGTDGTAGGQNGLVPAPVATDAGKFLNANGSWEEVQAGPTVVQTTGTSTTDVMSQNAVTSMVFADPTQKQKVQIGNSSNASGANSIGIGVSPNATSRNAVAIGSSATAAHDESIALGFGATTSAAGEMNIGAGTSGRGYNSSNYRLLTGLYDGQSAHDAATKGQLDSIAIQNAGAPTTATVGTVGQLLEDTANGKLYICTDTTGGNYIWVEVGAGGGSGITELTAADYNYPTDNPTQVSLCLLDSGIYAWGSGVVVRAANSGELLSPMGVAIVNNPGDTSNKKIWVLNDGGSEFGTRYSNLFRNYTVAPSGVQLAIESALTTAQVVNNLTSTRQKSPLSANQGKVLKDLIDSIAIRGAGAPTTSTVGEVGQLYEDGTNGALYQLKSIDITVTPNTYNWEEVGAGGGGSGVIELTSADYNYPTTGAPTSVALWLLSDGVYVVTESINIYQHADSQTTYTAGTIVQIKSGSSGNVRAQSFYPSGSIEWKDINATTGVLISSKTYLTSYNVQQSTGTSTTNVMSQNAVSSMVFADPSQKTRISLGNTAQVNGTRAIAIGAYSNAAQSGAIALGAGAQTSAIGEMNIGSNITSYGYNSSNYRLLTGLYDPQNAHDAATKGYVDPTTDSSAPTTATVGRLGQIQIDTTTATAYMCVAVDTVTPAYTWKQITA